jgi:hypothetical protein
LTTSHEIAAAISPTGKTAKFGTRILRKNSEAAKVAPVLERKSDPQEPIPSSIYYDYGALDAIPTVIVSALATDDYPVQHADEA